MSAPECSNDWIGLGEWDLHRMTSLSPQICGLLTGQVRWECWPEASFQSNWLGDQSNGREVGTAEIQESEASGSGRATSIACLVNSVTESKSLSAIIPFGTIQDPPQAMTLFRDR